MFLTDSTFIAHELAIYQLHTLFGIRTPFHPHWTRNLKNALIEYIGTSATSWSNC